MLQCVCFHQVLREEVALVEEGFGAVWSTLSTMPWPPPPATTNTWETCNSSAVATRACVPHSCLVAGGR